MIPVFIVCGKSPFKGLGGGYSSYAYNLSIVLKKLHFEVYIISLGDSKTTALPLLPWYSLLFALKIQQITNSKDYQKIIVWGIGPWGLTGIYLKLLMRKKVILINHYFTTIKHEWKGALEGLQTKDYGVLIKVKYLIIYYTIVQFLSLLERILLGNANLIVTNYHSTEQILKDEFNLIPSKFYKASFWVKPFKRDLKYILNQRLPKKFILCLSRQDLRKGINFLLHAMAILIQKGHNIPLIIAGSGEMLKANQKLAKKLGISHFVKFLGFVSDPKTLMEKATIFCLPTIEEGAGALVINEAMSEGLPIITTNTDGISEDIKDYKSGLLIPAKDPKELADAILKLWQDQILAKRLGRNAKKEFNARFTQKKMGSDIKRLIFPFL